MRLRTLGLVLVNLTLRTYTRMDNGYVNAYKGALCGLVRVGIYRYYEDDVPLLGRTAVCIYPLVIIADDRQTCAIGPTVLLIEDIRYAIGSAESFVN